MRVINAKHETITEYDLAAGQLIPVVVIREGVEPIDNITKFAWADVDYEEVLMYIPFSSKTAAQQIQELKAQLSATDYKVIKCAECRLLGADVPYNVEELHAERQILRDKINELEAIEND